MSYVPKTWDGTSYVTPSAMNNIEEGISAIDSVIDDLPITEDVNDWDGQAYRDADRLGGQLPAYYAKTSDLTNMSVKVKTVTLPSSQTWGTYSIPDGSSIVNVVVNNQSQILVGNTAYDWFFSDSQVYVCPRQSEMYSKQARIFYI